MGTSKKRITPWVPTISFCSLSISKLLAVKYQSIFSGVQVVQVALSKTKMSAFSIVNFFAVPFPRVSLSSYVGVSIDPSRASTLNFPLGPLKVVLPLDNSALPSRSAISVSGLQVISSAFNTAPFRRICARPLRCISRSTTPSITSLEVKVRACPSAIGLPTRN